MFNFLKFFRFLKSTILIKIVMALTGLAIVGFLFMHAIGNLQFWSSPDVYNTYAAFLQEPFGLAELLWVLRIGLILCVVLHIISAVYLRIKNNAAKPVGYQIKNYAKAKLTTRTMLWTGLMLLMGILFHLLHFTTGTFNFENGYNQYEIYPTGGYVNCYGECPDVFCPDAMDCHKTKDECNKPCQMADVSRSDKPCQGEFLFECKVINDDGKRFVVYGNDTFSVDCYMMRTGLKWEDVKVEEVVRDGIKAQKTCGGECPEGDKMCGKCEANPEQCSKFAKTECDTKDACCGSCCDAPIYNVYQKANQGEITNTRPDVYAMVKAEFSNTWIVLVYVIFVMLVGFHLNHAIQSAIHTLGIEGPKFTPVMRVLSTLLSVGLVLLFILLPIGVLLANLFGFNCLFGGC